MIDIHSHVLPGIDDGSRSLAESLEMLKKMENIGFTDIICTPHYIENTKYIYNNTQKERILNIVQYAARQAGLKINLHPGNEVFVSNNLRALAAAGQISTLNKTTILFELPRETKINNLNDLVFDVRIHGYDLILAHPERYLEFQKNPALTIELHKKGVRFQCNYSSIRGYYGKESKRLAKFLFKNHLVDYLGTDIHHANSSFYEEFPKIRRKITKLAGEGYMKILDRNAKVLLNA